MCQSSSIDALDAIEELVENKAVWHKSCHLQLSNSRLAKAKERSERIRKRERERDDGEVRLSKSRRLSGCQNAKPESCTACGQAGGKQLHEVSTFATNEKVRHMVTELQDNAILPRISDVDLMAADARYHLKCVTELRNRYRCHLTRKREENFEKEEEKIKESQAFVELTENIKDCTIDDKLIFQLSELHSLYTSRLQTLGVVKQINKMRLKNSILETFPEAQDQSDGKNTLIVFKKAMQQLLKDAEQVQQRDFSEDATILTKASVVIRKDLFDHEASQTVASNVLSRLV